MELALRTLKEYPEALVGFREELADIAKSEAEHLRQCLLAIESLGFKWGNWPVHTVLWDCVRPEDSLLNRILIVHRYLEGSGLDSGDTLLRRINGISEGPLNGVVKLIATEEVGHVEFGSRWYREICRLEKIDPAEDFALRMNSLRWQIPKRVEPIAVDLRRQAGFSESEIEFLIQFRELQLRPSSIKTSHSGPEISSVPLANCQA